MASIDQYLKKKGNVAVDGLNQDALNQDFTNLVCDINVSKIDTMPGNDDMFPTDENVLLLLEQEIKTNGFRDPIKVIKKDNRYICVSGNQRLTVVRDRLKESTIKCYILQDIDDREVRDLWRSENIIHRKLTPLTYAKLVTSYMKDYDDYHLKGGKRDYAASKTGISKSSLNRYLAILKFPEYIQQCCNIVDFPYALLVNVIDLPKEKKEQISDKLKEWFDNNPNQMIAASEFKVIIKMVAEGDDETRPAEHTKYFDECVGTFLKQIKSIKDYPVQDKETVLKTLDEITEAVNEMRNRL